MSRCRSHVLTAAGASLGVLVAMPAHAASLTEVSRSTWAGSVTLPSYVQMYIYVPDKVATNPPIVVSAHSCGSTASGQMGNIPLTQAAADSSGFILILPDNPGQNCWDVGSTQSLTHDGGGDTQAVAQMVKYALSKYNGDATRVYIFGGSSGGMLTQAMLAVYPDLFRAGSARAGVPAGCWANGYSASNQWSNNCANGDVDMTAQQWGDLVRAMDPGYTGHRPRLQTMQGEADTTISYKNTGEAIKEWTNVFALSTNPTSTDTGYKAANATYDRQFWANSCGYDVFEAWSSPGGTHSMPYEEADILKFFGLDASGPDPEVDDCADGGFGAADAATDSGRGTSGSVDAGGSSGTSGNSGTREGGSGTSGGTTGASGGAMGSTGSNSGATAGSSTGIGQSGSGSGVTSGSANGSGSSSGAGTGSKTESGSGSGSQSPGSGTSEPPGSGSGGCSFGGEGMPQRSIPLAAEILVALGLVARRRRSTRPRRSTSD
jgi:acetylxylan esterase